MISRIKSIIFTSQFSTLPCMKKMRWHLEKRTRFSDTVTAQLSERARTETDLRKYNALKIVLSGNLNLQRQIQKATQERKRCCADYSEKFSIKTGRTRLLIDQAIRTFGP